METVKRVLRSNAMETMLLSLASTINLISLDESLYGVEQTDLREIARKLEELRVSVFHRHNIARSELKELGQNS